MSAPPRDLERLTARDLMSPNPLSIREDATDVDAMRLLADKGVSGLLVIGPAGRPTGVVTATDMLIHQRQRVGSAPKAAAEPVQVRDFMTPAVFSVRLSATTKQVIEQMTALNVHRLFVVDDSEVVVGVVTPLDLLRHLT